jgi:hypothetical protein
MAGTAREPVPSSAASTVTALSSLRAITSIPKCSRACASARSASVRLSEGASPAISSRTRAQPGASGAPGHSHPVDDDSIRTLTQSMSYPPPSTSEYSLQSIERINQGAISGESQWQRYVRYPVTLIGLRVNTDHGQQFTYCINPHPR